jgi:hypothetical protein
MPGAPCVPEARPTRTEADQETVVQLIIYYLVFMIAGDFAAYLIGLVVEREFGTHTICFLRFIYVDGPCMTVTGSGASLIVFLVLYFLFLWIAWLIAVRVTEPRGGPERVSF